MRILKVILFLVLLFSISVFGQPTTLEHTLEIPGDTMNWDPDYRYWQYTVDSDRPETLLDWFKSLTLDEKIDVYNYWKNDSVTLSADDVFPKLIIHQNN